MVKEPEAYNLKEILQIIKIPKQKEASNTELTHEISILKSEINDLKTRITILELAQPKMVELDEENVEEELMESKEDLNSLVYINMINRVITHKWLISVTIIVQKEYMFNAKAMVDSGADINCINEGLVP